MAHTNSDGEVVGKSLTKAEYNPEIMDAIIDWWRKTHHKGGAAAAGGISHNTLNTYLERGENGEPLFCEFLQRFKKAEAEWVADHLQAIDNAVAEGQWQPAAWQLERHLPNEFGQKQRIGIGQDPTAEPAQVTWVDAVKKGQAKRNGGDGDAEDEAPTD